MRPDMVFFTIKGFYECLINRKKEGSKFRNDITNLLEALRSGNI